MLPALATEMPRQWSEHLCPLALPTMGRTAGVSSGQHCEPHITHAEVSRVVLPQAHPAISAMTFLQAHPEVSAMTLTQA